MAGWLACWPAGSRSAPATQLLTRDLLNYNFITFSTPGAPANLGRSHRPPQTTTGTGAGIRWLVRWFVGWLLMLLMHPRTAVRMRKINPQCNQQTNKMERTCEVLWLWSGSGRWVRIACCLLVMVQLSAASLLNGSLRNRNKLRELRERPLMLAG